MIDQSIIDDVMNELLQRLDPLYPDRFDCYEDYPRDDFRRTLNRMVEDGLLIYDDGKYGLAPDNNW